MTDAAEHDLKSAEAVLAEKQDDATRAQLACLSAIAEGLPAAVDALAKQIALSQPDVTKSLGAERVRQLRADLAQRAEELATDIAKDNGQIQWPAMYSDYSVVEPGMVRNSLFTYMYGSRANSLAAVFKTHGYDVLDDNAQSAQGLVHPYSLFDDGLLKPVADAMTALAPAKRALVNAKKAHDDDIVADIWDES